MRHATFPCVVAGGRLLAGQTLAGDAIAIHPDREARAPAIASDSKGSLHLAYVSADPGAMVPDIFHCQSTDGGRTWEPATNVSRSHRTRGISFSPAIACGKEGHEVIVWTDTSSGIERPDIYSVFSADGGKAWSNAIDISNTPGKSMDPAVAIASDGTVHVVWTDTTDSDRGPQVWYSRSVDDGATWSKATNMSHTLGEARSPSLACGPEGGEILVCWSDKLLDEPAPEIFFTSSFDDGTTFGEAINVSHTVGDARAPEIAVDERGIYIVWSDTSGAKGKRDVFFIASRDGGKTWNKRVDVAPTSGASTEPALSADKGNIAVVWRATTGRHEWNPHIWLALSSDHGYSFTDPCDISNTPGASKHPYVAIANGAVHVVWQEREKGLTHLTLTSVPLAEH